MNTTPRWPMLQFMSPFLARPGPRGMSAIAPLLEAQRTAHQQFAIALGGTSRTGSARYFAGGFSGLSAHLRAAGSRSGSTSQVVQTKCCGPRSGWSGTSFIGRPQTGHGFRIGNSTAIGSPCHRQLRSARRFGASASRKVVRPTSLARYGHVTQDREIRPRAPVTEISRPDRQRTPSRSDCPAGFPAKAR